MLNFQIKMVANVASTEYNATVTQSETANPLPQREKVYLIHL